MRFDRDDVRYHIWKAKSLVHLKTINLKDAVLGSELAAGANAQEAAEVARDVIQISGNHMQMFRMEEQDRWFAPMILLIKYIA